MIRTELNPVAPPPRDITAEMADAMRRLAFSGATVDSSALELEGFSFEEIKEHWRAAATVAFRTSIRRVEAA